MDYQLQGSRTKKPLAISHVDYNIEVEVRGSTQYIVTTKKCIFPKQIDRDRCQKCVRFPEGILYLNRGKGLEQVNKTAGFVLSKSKSGRMFLLTDRDRTKTCLIKWVYAKVKLGTI